MKKILSFLILIILSFSMIFAGCGGNDYKYNNHEYQAFNNISEAKYRIPGLEDDFIPQGLDYSEEKDLIIISGYYKENNDRHPSSVLYTVNGTNGKVEGRYNIKLPSGNYYKGHAGGVAVTSKNIFIGNWNNLYRISLSQLNNLEGDTLQIDQVIQVPVRASFCNFSNGILWAGDFYIPGNEYTLPENRPWPEGTTREMPWIVGFELENTESEFGTNWNSETMSYATPNYVFLCNQSVQGFTFIGNKAVTSCSFNRTNNSNISIHANPLDSKNTSTVILNGVNVPVWDMTKREAKYTTMPLSEGVCDRNGKLLVLFESGAKFFLEENATAPTEHIWQMSLPN